MGTDWSEDGRLLHARYGGIAGNGVRKADVPVRRPCSPGPSWNGGREWYVGWLVDVPIIVYWSVTLMSF
jgi:hypothetical protein